MNRLGTDVVALAAILGSGAVGGAVTLAALDRGPQPAVADCVAASVVSAPRVVVASGHNGHSIVIAPRVRMHATGACADGVLVDGVIVGERIQADLERALAELDRNRVKLEQAYDLDVERRLNEEMARLEQELARLGDEVGR